MKIAIFTDSYGPKIDGVVTLTKIMKRSFESLGHEVVIVAPKPIGHKPEHSPEVFYLAAVGGIFFEGQYTTSPIFSQSTINRLSSINPDIIFFLAPGQIGLLGAKVAKQLDVPLVAIHTTDFYEYISVYKRAVPAILAVAIMASAAFDINSSKLIKSIQITNRPEYEKLTQNLVKQITSLIYSNCDLVLAPSLKTKNQLASWGIKTKIEAIPCGVDPLPSYDQADIWRQKLNLNPSDKIILYIGRLAKEKNLDLLIEAFKKLATNQPSAKLMFVGEFNYQRKLRELAKKSGFNDRIIFTGRVPRAKLGGLYSLASAFVFPSLTDTQGLVLNEAALAGAPLVMIDRQLTDLLVEGETGFYADNTAKDLAAKITQVINLPPKQWQAMSNAIKQRAGKYSEQNQAKKMLAELERLL